MVYMYDHVQHKRASQSAEKVEVIFRMNRAITRRAMTAEVCQDLLLFHLILMVVMPSKFSLIQKISYRYNIFSLYPST